MEFSRKYILVDPIKYEKLVAMESKSKQLDSTAKDSSIFAHPNVERVYELDNEMKDVLNDSSLSDFDKAMQYGEKLQSYLGNFRTALSKPKTNALIGPIPKPINQQNLNTDTKEDTKLGIDKLITTIPKTYHSKATHLLDFMKTNPNIAWRDDGKIIYKDQVLTESTITTLVGDMIRLRKPRSDEKDVNLFLSALETEGYPTSKLPRTGIKGRSVSQFINSKIPTPERLKPHKKPNKVIAKVKSKSVKESGRTKTPASGKSLSTLLSKWKTV